MKICFISLMSGLPWGGSEILWSKTAQLALDKNHEVFVSVYDWGTETNQWISQLENHGASVHLRSRYSSDMPPIRKLIRYIQRRYLTGSQWRWLLKEKPDHVLVNQGSCFDILEHHIDLYQLLNENRIEYSLLSHSHPQFSYLPEKNIYPGGIVVYRQAKHTFFVSETQRRFVETRLLTKLTNSWISWNPLNLDDYSIIPWPSADILQFAMVGALVSGKGHDIAFEILASHKWKDREWHLNIFGSGYGLSYLKDLACHLGISSKVTFYGHVKSVNEIWEKNHVLLFPSSGEGMPIALIEAQVAGRPVVTSDVGGIKEIIKENYNGYISEGPTSKAFLKTMEIMWNDRVSLKLLGVNAHQLVKSLILNPEKVLLNKLIEN